MRLADSNVDVNSNLTFEWSRCTLASERDWSRDTADVPRYSATTFHLSCIPKKLPLRAYTSSSFIHG